MNAPLKLDTALERTLKLAEQGFYLFPSWGKDRHIAGWPARATRDAGTLRAWFTGPYKDCWPSIFTGKFGDGSQSLIVVDVDPRGLAAVDVLDSLLPDTRVHRTPRKGLHGFYVAPFPGVKSGTNVLADGIDIRGKGGLVHFGEGYTIEQDEPIAQAPASLIAKCGELAPATTPADRAQDRISPDQETALQRAEEIMRTWPKVGEGERNTALRDFIYRVRENCATDADSTLTIGLSFAAEICEPSYPEDEARATIRSAIKSAQNPAGSKTALPQDFPVQPSADTSPSSKAQPVDAKAKTRQPRAYLTTQDFAARVADGAGYVVKGLLSRNSYAVWYGSPGAGKTFTALDLAYAVAQGRDWMGRKVNGGIVVYVPFEGAGGLAKRVRALVQKYGHAPNFRAIENPDYNLRELPGRQAFGQDMAAALGNEKPALVIFDTLARSLKGGEENSAKDMGALNDALGALIENTGCCALLIHHSGKDKSAGARGSSALLGAIDTEILIDDSQIVSTKQRDVEISAPIGFKLAPVVVGVDADGDDIVSCTVEPAMADARAKRKPTGQALEARNALCKLAPDNVPVSKADWQSAFAREAWPTDPPEADGQRRAFQRAVKALVSAGWVVDTGQGWQRPLTGGSDG